MPEASRDRVIDRQSDAFLEARDSVPASRGGSASSPTAVEEARGLSMGKGLLVGVLAALAIGWVPLLGAIATGLACGWTARRRYRAIYVAQLPAILCMMWFWLSTYLPEIPPARAIADTILDPDLFWGQGAYVSAAAVVTPFLVVLAMAWAGAWLRERREGDFDAGYRWPRPV